MLIMAKIIKLTDQGMANKAAKIVLYIQTTWLIQLKFEIHTFGVIVIQTKIRTPFR